MHILVGLALAVALLYFWLIGHWFGRVLAFLIFGAVFGAGGFVAGVTFAPAPPAAIAQAHSAPVYKNLAHERRLAELKAMPSRTAAEIDAMDIAVGREIANGATDDGIDTAPSAPTPSAPTSPIMPSLGVVIGIILAWPISGIPIYSRRQQQVVRPL